MTVSSLSLLQSKSIVNGSQVAVLLAGLHKRLQSQSRTARRLPAVTDQFLICRIIGLTQGRHNAMLSGYGRKRTFPRPLYQGSGGQDSELTLPALWEFGLERRARGVQVPNPFANRIHGKLWIRTAFCGSGLQCLRKYAIRQCAQVRRFLQGGYLSEHYAIKQRRFHTIKGLD